MTTISTPPMSLTRPRSLTSDLQLEDDSLINRVKDLLASNKIDEAKALLNQEEAESLSASFASWSLIEDPLKEVRALIEEAETQASQEAAPQAPDAQVPFNWGWKKA